MPVNSEYWIKECLQTYDLLTLSNYLYDQWNYDLLNLSKTDKTYK